MAMNYYIGIGGTGARVAESLLHLCAAGYGPNRLKLFIIDPDEGNGNLSRTKELIARYQTARRHLQDQAAPGFPLFATEISTPDPLVWSIFEHGNTRLADYINYANLKSADRPLHDLAGLLFTQAELREQLDEGFRGHPSIGAVVMAEPDEDADPWRSFWTDVEKAQKPGDVRVFLAGSIFGGTGAAGVPTFGAPEMIKFHPRAKIDDATSKVQLGACLVLPYFTFDTAGATGPEAQRLFVTAADFPIATKAALQFYNEKDLAYDQLYLVGDSLAQSVGDFSPGSAKQENRPHYVELAAALAAEDFLLQPEGENPSGRYYIAGRRGKEVGWQSLPLTHDAEQVTARRDLLKRRLVAMATFAYAFLEFGYPLLDTPPGDVDYAWHEDHFYPKKGVFRRDESRDPRQPEQKAVLTAVKEYSERFLAWAAALDEGADGPVALLNRSRLLNGGDTVDHEQELAAIGTFLRESSKELDFNHFKNLLDQPTTLSDRLSPAGKYAGLFYEAARRFAEENYAVTPTPGRAGATADR
ncbi:MAG: hypothetical protein HKN04_03090 [Rhodothermaceae bacterium]|nr:hypothetical protein [Rhodothermaceae bacterium]